jgi:hypothetical protein
MPVFAVLAHKQPALLSRLVSRLAPYPVVVHVDAQSDHTAFDRALRGLDNVRLVPPHESVRVRWAAFSVVEATMCLYRHALRGLAPDEHIVLLSGQDYPLRPVEDFVDYLGTSPWRQHARLVDPWTGGPRDAEHFLRGHFQDMALFPNAVRWGRLDRMNLGLRRTLRATLGRGPRRAPDGLRLAQGSQWTALTAECVQELLDCASPSVQRFFRRVWAPDERMFQSLLASSRFVQETPAGALESVRVDEWPANFHLLDQTLDRFYVDGDEMELRGSNACFVRKVSWPESASLLDEIDAGLVRLSRSSL